MTGPSRRVIALLCGVAFAFAATGCGDDSTTTARGEAVVVEDLWTRPSPPIAGAAAFFLEISNDGPDDERITAVSAPGCAETLVHSTAVDDGGVATMQPAADADLAVASGDRLVMEPLGVHVMCLGPEKPFVEGETFELTIEFEPGGAITATGTVENR